MLAVKIDIVNRFGKNEVFLSKLWYVLCWMMCVSLIFERESFSFFVWTMVVLSCIDCLLEWCSSILAQQTFFNEEKICCGKYVIYYKLFHIALVLQMEEEDWILSTLMFTSKDFRKWLTTIQRKYIKKKRKIRSTFYGIP